ncbi:hypothetical protein [Variovorax sp. RA8]|uniref:hypothetical protein n=1 Tax=Variovorax sp. (strain JCM 16519 / RA8) TaxID=662548 RepID=UPI0013A559EE|nr:hypothetical protein [Variovorax sp. RA8]
MTDDDKPTEYQVNFDRLMEFLRGDNPQMFFDQNPSPEVIADVVACSLDVGLDGIASFAALEGLKKGIVKDFRESPGVIYQETIAQSFEKSDYGKILLMSGWTQPNNKSQNDRT